MSPYQSVALLLALIGPALAGARALGVPPSLALFALGLLSNLVPGLPSEPVDPDLVLALFLPPLLYASTVRVSWRLLRFTLLPGVLMGVLLAGATILVAAVVTRHALLPGLSWQAALLLAAVASIFDTRLFHEAAGRPHVPRAISDTLKARELVGRLMVLATVALVTEEGSADAIGIGQLAEHYLLDIVGGALLGLIVGYVIILARRRIEPAPVEIAVSIATPYAAALGATAAGLSTVASVTTAALAVSAVRIDRQTGETISSSETRVSSTAFWEELNLLVSSVMYLLAGRALPQALGALSDVPVTRIGMATLGLLALVLLVQLAFGYVATYLQPISGALRAQTDGGGTRRSAAATVMVWSSTRSVIGLVIALSAPAPLAERDLVLVVAAAVIILSVVLQGLTLRRVIGSVALGNNDRAREEEEARRAIESAHAAPAGSSANGFDAARLALLRLREHDRIGDETLIAMLRETDLAARASEGNALPGAGPPNP